MTPDAHTLAAHYLAQAREHGTEGMIQALAIMLAKERAKVRSAHRIVWTLLAWLGGRHNAADCQAWPSCGACMAVGCAAEWVRENAKQEGKS